MIAGDLLEVMDTHTLAAKQYQMDPMKHRIAFGRTCMVSLDKSIWQSTTRLNTKLQLYKSYVLPVLICSCKTLTIAEDLNKELGFPKRTISIT